MGNCRVKCTVQDEVHASERCIVKLVQLIKVVNNVVNFTERAGKISHMYSHSSIAISSPIRAQKNQEIFVVGNCSHRNLNTKNNPITQSQGGNRPV